MKKNLLKLNKGSDKLQIIRFIIVVFLLFVANSTESYGVSQVFFVIAYFITAFEALYKGFKSVSKRSFISEDILFLLAALLSLVLGINHAAIIVNLYYYTIYIEKAVIKYKQDMFILNSENNIEHVNVVNELGAVSVTSPEYIKKGDIVVVNPGECILTDGIVTDGFTTVNTEAVTHDNVPKEISINDKVMAGYVNLTAPITYKSKCDIYSSHIEAEKTLAKKAVDKSSAIYSFIKRYSRIASALFLFISLIMLLISIFTDIDFDRVVTLVIVSGMVSLRTCVQYILSDSVYTGIKNSVLFKKADSVIELSSVSTAIIEFKSKIGDFVVESAEVYDEYSENNLKDLASCLYSKSTLPFAEAVCKYSGLIDSSSRISGFRELDHSGCFAYVDGHQIVSGTTQFMKKSKIHIPFTAGDEFAGVHFAVDGTYIGNIRFAFNDFYKLSRTITDMKCCGIKHFVIFGIEDESGADRIRNSLKADYFSITDDRTRIINDIMDNVSGRIAIFGWHDWLVSGVNSIYLGSGRVDSEYVDADVVVSGQSVLHASKVIRISNLARYLSNIATAIMLVFKALIVIFALTGHASVYFAIIGELIIYSALAFVSTFKFKNI